MSDNERHGGVNFVPFIKQIEYAFEKYEDPLVRAGALSAVLSLFEDALIEDFAKFLKDRTEKLP